VKPELRDHGVGRRLKEFQREQLVAAGIEWMYWTVDPLVARNAHLNLNRLHVQIRDYVPDMYGDTGSNLHAFGTDRFVVAWPVSGATGTNRRARDGERAGLWETAILNGLDERTLETLFLPSARPWLVRVEIPMNIESLGIAEAFAWRTATRRSFLAALKAGYEVSGFCCSGDNRCFYLLSVRTDVVSHH
jgi:predicted GNAT superfamily acetyltransferase